VHNGKGEDEEDKDATAVVVDEEVIEAADDER
jgi:hypothetical protein